MRSFEVEEVKKLGEDYILDIDILPNRAHDCLSHLGVARECAALLKSEIRNPKSETNSKIKIQNKKLLRIEISDNALCPRYCAYVIEGVAVKESPLWVRERLAAMGQKPINNVVDVTNYIMWELGQPLHAFDFSKIQGARMNIRLSKQGEKLKTLDGVTFDLPNDTIVIEDGERLIDLAGIKGGVNSHIEQSTHTVIFQAAIFDSSRIRRTMQGLGIRTEASVRYMHGFDPELPLQALDRAMELLYESSPDIRLAQKIDVYENHVKPKEISLDVNYVNKLLGTYLSIREARQILERLNYQVKRGKLDVKSSKLEVTVPTYRLDIHIPEDLIEEIGRIYGYEKIEQSAPYGMLIAPRENERLSWRSRARNICAGFGFEEVYNYSLGLKLMPQLRGCTQFELENPVSEEFRYARIMLLPGVLKNIASNVRYFEKIHLFEFGKVFYKENDKVEERENCILALYDANDREGKESFYQMKGYVDEFLQKLGVSDFYYDEALSDADLHKVFLHPERAANIMVDQKFAGFIGEVHPSFRSSFDVTGRVFCAEFDFDRIERACEEEHMYQKPSKYPEVVRDIALLVPPGTMVEEVENSIHEVSGPLLSDVDLFDMYEGENLPEGMKNLAFHLLFQSDERTLTAKEVDEIMGKITKTLEEKSWEVR
ncbi:MAG: phenylalanine--tRNA ligase subunit beta [Candidatus Spechtbacteria bacterium]|nr:phenylalanine--tRNA ligase subunit beta [Candidatus Spechtbacteria bacterium]